MTTLSLTSKGNAKRNKHYIYFVRIGEPSARLFKIGTTNNMDRRMKEHKRYYKQDIEVLGVIPVTSEYTTLRVERDTKAKWIEETDWEYMRNDRFIIPEEVEEITIKVRKEYKIKIR